MRGSSRVTKEAAREVQESREDELDAADAAPVAAAAVAIAPREDDEPPPPAPEKDRKPKPPERAPAERQSAIMAGIQREEERSLRDWLDEIGPQGSFRIQVRRIKPSYVMVNGKEVNTEGFLDTFDTPVDEDELRRKYGGGQFGLKVTLKRADGSFGFSKGLQRVVTIAGEPNLDRLPHATPPPAPAQAGTGGDSPQLVKETFSFLRDHLNQQSARGREPDGIPPGVQMMLEQMRASDERRDQEVSELRRELDRARGAKPVEDPIKDKILSNLLDGNSGQVEALRLRYEAELRQTKELSASELKRERDHAVETERRMADRAERDRDEMKRGFERELAALRQSHEVAVAAARGSHDVQVTVLKGEVTRLQREVDGLQGEVKDLRAKKDKTLIEQAKDIQAAREALGIGEDDTNKNWADKMVEFAQTPVATEILGRVMGGGGPAPAAAAAPVAAAQPRFVRSRRTGQRFVQGPDGQLREVVRKPQVAMPAVVAEDGRVVTPAVEMPQVDPQQIAQLIGLLESAFQAGQDPEVVAQGGRTNAPALVQWIIENHTEQTAGVDLFMSKVAKLPGTSPLATQAGKNWIRKVGKALVGG